VKIVVLSGSNIGTKTRTAMNYVVKVLMDKYSEHDVTLLDLAELDMMFSDGRNYMEYDGDTKYIAETMMLADAIVIGTPIFQASIPASLKNVFDILPEAAFQEKVVSIVVTAGSSKHYLIAEQQVKPILSFMKANTVQQYVFLETKDFHRGTIVNDDVLFRLDRLVEDTMMSRKVLEAIQEEKEKVYGF